MGKPIDINNAADHIFGLVLMNDWSGTCPIPNLIFNVTSSSFVDTLLNWFWQPEIFRDGNTFLLVLFLEKVLVRNFDSLLHSLSAIGKARDWHRYPI